MNERRKQRLTYIDWMRGLACLLMFQTHCYDSWLSDAARSTKFFSWSQLGGTLPAPLFLFLAGISFALATDKLRQRGVAANEIARSTLRRSAEIFGLGLLFRVQEYLLGQPSAPWTDLLRVDVLTMIGLSMMLMASVSRLAVGCGRSDDGRPRLVVRRAAPADLRCVRFLAYQPEFLPHPCRPNHGNSVCELCLVPLGRGAVGVQPRHPVGADVAACLLGSH